MLPQALALVAALSSAPLDPVEVATRHEKAGRPELALHLLDRITAGKGDAAAQAVRARLMKRLGIVGGGAPRPAVSATPAPPPPAGPDPVALFKQEQWVAAARIFRARLQGNPKDFTTFSYLAKCYYNEAERLADAHEIEAGRKAYLEGQHVEQLYGGNFPDVAASFAPDGLAAKLGL